MERKHIDRPVLFHPDIAELPPRLTPRAPVCDLKTGQSCLGKGLLYSILDRGTG